LAKRLDLRRGIAVSALTGATSNLQLLPVPLDGVVAVELWGLAGISLARFYPVGMKIAIGQGTKCRSFPVWMMIGELNVDVVAPHFISYLGGADWRFTVMAPT